MTIFDSYTGDYVVQNNSKLPTPGTYLSVITDAYGMGITPSFKKNDGCFLVKYKLLSEKDFSESTFEETYYPDVSNSRGDEFFAYLNKHFPYVGESDAYIGTREKLEIGLDILGGFAYPVVNKREFIGYGAIYTENYLNTEDNEDEEDCED